MRICSVSNIYSYDNNLKQNFSGKFKSPLNTTDTQSWLSSVLRENKVAPQAQDIENGALLLNLIHTMSGIEYLNLTAKQKQVLRNITPDEIKIHVEDNYNIACKFRNYLKKNYGNNYSLLIIGRSLASVGETLSHMSADVKFLPMSGMMRYNRLKDSIKGQDVYRQYLASIGLTKERIRANQNHQYLIMDYVGSGNSLKNAYTVLTSEEFLGSSLNIKALGSEDIMGWNYNGLLHDQELKRYSPVGVLYLGKWDEVFKAANPYKYDYNGYNLYMDRRKLFRFQTFELLDRNKELKSLC